MSVKIDLQGADRIAAAMVRYPTDVAKALKAAGREAANLILAQEGLRKYPQSTAANQPGRVKTVQFSDGTVANFRQGYYVRGRGAQVPIRGGGYRSLDNSERLGSQWFVDNADYVTTIANRASYARFVVGDEQAKWMEVIGWRKLSDVGNEQIDGITRIYQGWIDRMLANIAS